MGLEVKIMIEVVQVDGFEPLKIGGNDILKIGRSYSPILT